MSRARGQVGGECWPPGDFRHHPWSPLLSPYKEKGPYRCDYVEGLRVGRPGVGPLEMEAGGGVTHDEVGGVATAGRQRREGQGRAL